LLKNVIADEDLSMLLLFVAAGIGFVVGIIAVLVAAPFRASLGSSVLGAIAGAVLAYGAAMLTFLPLFWGGLLGIDGIQVIDDEAPIYGVAMAVSGAIAGGCGALLQSRLSGVSRSTPLRDVP
jgi:hypothetical protein